jgi:protein gp37
VALTAGGFGLAAAALPSARIRHGCRRTIFDVLSDLFGDFVLTKRAARMATWTAEQRWIAPAPDVWLGVSVEDVRHGLPRIELLRRSPAAVRFLSVEPLLEDLASLDLDGARSGRVGPASGRSRRRPRSLPRARLATRRRRVLTRWRDPLG